jgi:hypothetical protein
MWDSGNAKALSCLLWSNEMKIDGETKEIPQKDGFQCRSSEKLEFKRSLGIDEHNMNIVQLFRIG